MSKIMLYKSDNRRRILRYIVVYADIVAISKAENVSMLGGDSGHGIYIQHRSGKTDDIRFSSAELRDKSWDKLVNGLMSYHESHVVI